MWIGRHPMIGGLFNIGCKDIKFGCRKDVETLTHFCRNFQIYPNIRKSQ